MILQPGHYAILNADGTFREERTILVATPCKDGRAKPIDITPPPAVNPATHRVVQNGWVVNPSNVTPNWQTIALTQAELDENADLAQVATIVAAADSMIDGTATAATVRVALGRLLKRLVKKGVLP